MPLVIRLPEIDPVAFSIFGFEVHWYAIMYLIGFALAYMLMRRRLHHEPFRSTDKPGVWTRDDIEDLLIHAIFGVLLGGRLGYVVFYQPGYYLQHPLEIITGVRTGGMSFHGGVIGVVIGMLIYGLRRKRPFLQVADFLVPAVPLGLFCGRMGNFINGELWGRPAPESLPWAMIFPTGGDIARHPSQLYEALTEGLGLFIVLWLYARKPRYRGQVAALFLFGYGLARFVCEFFREPDSFLGLLSMGLSMGQWLSAPMIIAGIVLWSWAQQAKISDLGTSGDPDTETDQPKDASEASEATEVEQTTDAT